MRLRTTILLAVLAASPAATADSVICVPAGSYTRPPRAPLPTPRDAGLPRLVWEGAPPAEPDPDLPVLVFVHGLHGSAASWWEATEYYGANDMYDAARAAGFRTWFVDLWDAEGEAPTPIKNGRLLRNQIRWIAAREGVERVNVVAHSKGGLDSNTAALLGAPVDSIFTLSSPHHGSPLADLAQTSWFEWLGDLLGYNDAGTKSLQTGCMALFRAVADARPENERFSIFTSAATGWGPLLSSLRLGGLYLAEACPATANDGLVCVEHALHPLSRDPAGAVTGEHRIVWQPGGPFELDHDNVRMGSALIDFVWPWEPDDCFVPVFEAVRPYVSTLHGGGPVTPAAVAAGDVAAHRAGLLLRGGPVGPGPAMARLPVDAGVRALELRVLVTDARARVTLQDPRGRRHRLGVPRPDGGPLFRGAHLAALTVDDPAAGQWTARVTAPRRGAYALVALPDGGAATWVEGPREPLDPGEAAWLAARGEAGSLAWQVEVRRISTAGPPRAVGTLRFAGPGPHPVALDGPGVYLLEANLEGISPAGGPFQRQQAIPVAVRDPGEATLPPACR